MSEAENSAPRDAVAPIGGRVRPLPDKRYFKRVIKRQTPYAIMLAILCVCAAIPTAIMQETLYSSRITVAYDPRDSTESNKNFAAYPSFSQISFMFGEQFKNRMFLAELAQMTGALEEEAQKKAKFEKQFKGLAPELFKIWQDGRATLKSKAKSNEQDLEETPEFAIAKALEKQLETEANDKSYLLSLTAFGPSPEDAQRLATMAMELFIKKQLEREEKRVSFVYGIFNRYLVEGPIVATPGLTTEGEKTMTSRDIRLKQEEANCINKITAIKSELADISRARGEKRAILEVERNTLATRFTPSHPEVIAKEEELRRFSSNDDTKRLHTQLNDLRVKLSAIRMEQRKLGMRVSMREDLDQPNADTTATPGAFLTSLTDRIGELGLEKLNMTSQVSNPEARTRLRLISEASFEPSPAKHSKRSLVLSFMILAAGFIGIFVVLRELNNPLARDAWRIASVTDLPCVGEIEDRGEDGIYGDFGLALRRECVGNRILVVPCWKKGDTAITFHQLAHSHARDTAGPVIVMDFDSEEPLSSALQEFAGQFSLTHYLERQVGWKDVALPKTGARAYKLVPPPHPHASRLGKIHGSPILGHLLMVLSKRFTTVILRGLKGNHRNENAALADHVSDVFLLVNAAKTTFADVKATLESFDRRKVRGFLLLGG